METKKRIILVCLILAFAVAGFFIYRSSATPLTTPASAKRYNLGEISELADKNEPTAVTAESATTSAPDLAEDFDILTGLFHVDYHRTSPFRSGKDLARFVAEDDVCSIHNSRFSREDAIKELLKAPDTVKEDPELDNILKELFGDAGLLNPKSADGEGRSSYLISEFFNALLFADMLSDIDSKTVDLDLAYRILENLNGLDPDNSAYSLFQAGILSKKNASLPEIKLMFLRAFSKPVFDSFHTTLSRRIREKAYASSSYFALSKATFIPYPKSLVWSSLLGKLINQKDDPEFAKAAAAYFERRTASRFPQNGSYGWLLWDVLDVTSAAAKLALIKKRYPQLTVRESPKLKAFKFWESPEYDLFKGVYEKMTQKDGTGIKCERELLDKIIPREKEAFLKALSEMN